MALESRLGSLEVAGQAGAGLVGDHELARQELERLRAEIEEIQRRDAGSASLAAEAETRSMALELRIGSLEVAGQVGAGLAGDHELARQELERLRADVEEIQRRDAGSASLATEAEARSLAFESRLGSLEATGLQAIEQGRLLGERLRGLEDAGAEQARSSRRSSGSASRPGRSSKPGPARPRSSGPGSPPAGPSIPRSARPSGTRRHVASTWRRAWRVSTPQGSKLSERSPSFGRSP